MKIIPAHRLFKPKHKGYLGFEGVNPNISIETIPRNAEYGWYCAWGDGNALTEDLNRLQRMVPRMISVCLGDEDYSVALNARNRRLHFSTAENHPSRCVPYYYEPHAEPFNGPLERPILASFRGSMTTNPKRQDLLELRQEGVIVEICEYWKVPEKDRANDYSRHQELLRTSKFTLCPRGKGKSSIRVMEAVMAGSIPVLIDDHSTPFGDRMLFSVRWSSAASVFWLYRLLKDMPQSEYHDRLKEMSAFRNDFLMIDKNSGCNGTIGFTEYIRRTVEQGLE